MEMPNEIDDRSLILSSLHETPTHCFVCQALFFVSFMVLCYFYVLNLVLAVAVNAYGESLSERGVESVLGAVGAQAPADDRGDVVGESRKCDGASAERGDSQTRGGEADGAEL